MRYLLLIAILLIAASGWGDTVFVYGTQDDGGDNPNDRYIVQPITIPGGTYTLDSIFVLAEDYGGTGDSLRVAVYRAYGDSSRVDTTLRWNVSASGSSQDRLAFQIGGTVKEDSTYWFGINGFENGTLRVSRDDTSSIPSYYYFTHPWETAWPSTMFSLGDGTEYTSDRMWIITVWGTAATGEPSTSSVIIWSAAKVGDACIGCE